MRRPSSYLAILFLIALVVTGCGAEEEILAPIPDPLPLNNTPEGAILRLIAAYQNRDAEEFGKLFTGDFAFEFSRAANPDLVQMFSAGFFREDERECVRNLFARAQPENSPFLPPARSVSLHFDRTKPVDDNSEGRDPAVYKRLLTDLSLLVTLDFYDPDGTLRQFKIGGSNPTQQRFFLVRGDVANDLDSDQPATAERWYIYRWRDESAGDKNRSPLDNDSNLRAPTQAQESTWGRLKALYVLPRY